MRPAGPRTRVPSVPRSLGGGAALVVAVLATGAPACSSSSDGGTPDAGATDGGPDTGLHPLEAGVDAEPPHVPVRVPVVISASGVFIQLSLDGGAPAYFNVDTAAWFSILDPTAAKAAGISPGDHDVTTVGSGPVFAPGTKTFRGLDMAISQVSFPELPPGAKVIGTAGNNMWKGYRVGFDPAGSALWLTPDEQPSTPRPDGLGAPIEIHGEHVPADDTIENDGIFTFPCAFAAGAPASTCMFDSGAPPPPTVIGALAASADYVSTKKVPSQAVDYTGKNLGGSYRLTAGLWADGKQVTSDQAVVVFDHFDVLEQEGAFFHRDIVGLLGASNAFYTELDMHDAVLRLFPYTAPRSTERSYFVGYGVIAIGSASGGASIAVATGSDAEAQGVKDTDVWVGVDGTTQDFSPVGVLLDDPGKSRTFSFLRAGQPLDVVLHAEDLLAP